MTFPSWVTKRLPAERPRPRDSPPQSPPDQLHVASPPPSGRPSSVTAAFLPSPQCETCSLRFRHKSQLRLHLRQKHGAITNTKIRYQVLDGPYASAC